MSGWPNSKPMVINTKMNDGSVTTFPSIAGLIGCRLTTHRLLAPMQLVCKVRVSP